MKSFRGNYEINEGILLAAAQYTTGANVHHINCLVYAYKTGSFHVCQTQKDADLLAVRITRILTGMDADEAYNLWKQERSN